MGATAKIATVTAAETKRRTIRRTRRPMKIKRGGAPMVSVQAPHTSKPAAAGKRGFVSAAKSATAGKRGFDSAARSSLPEAFPLRFEKVVLGQAPGEAEEAGVGDHPVRRPHAPSAHRPAPPQELERLQHPEAAKLPQAVEKALDLADVRAVGKEDASRSQRRLGARRRLPGFGEIEEHPVHLALLEAEVGVAQLQSQVRG